MSVRDDVMSAVMAMAQNTPGGAAYSEIVIGAMPAFGSISMTIATGAPESTFMTKNTAEQFSVALNGKHANMAILISSLDNIHAYLTRAKNYPSAASWQITNIETISAPSLIGRETDNQWLAGSSLRIKYYMRGI